MGKKILAVVVGYIAMVAFIFISFTISYLAMGTDGAFKPGGSRNSVFSENVS